MGGRASALGKVEEMEMETGGTLTRHAGKPMRDLMWFMYALRVLRLRGRIGTRATRGRRAARCEIPFVGGHAVLVRLERLA